MSAVQRANPLLRAGSEGGGIATVERVAARLIAPLTERLARPCGAAVQAITEPVTETSYAQWLGAEARPGVGYRFAKSLVMVVATEPEHVAGLLARRFGGEGGAGQALGRAGADLVRLMSDAVANALGAAFPALGAYEVLGHEPDLARGGFARESDIVVGTRFAIEQPGASTGRISIAFIASGLGRLNHDDEPPRSSGSGDWSDRLRANLLQTRMPVRAVLARPALPAATVAALAIGDVVPITKPGRIPLLIQAHRIATGTLEESDGRTAVRIAQMGGSGRG